MSVRLPRLVVGAAAVVAVAASAAGCGTPSGSTIALAENVDRILIVSLPGVGWEDVQHGELSTMPNLEEFVASAAIGGVPPSIGQTQDSTIEAYMTLGAGTRAIAPAHNKAVALDSDESYNGVAASDIFQRRLGFVPEGVAYLPMGAAAYANEGSRYGADPGLLGDEIDDAGISRAVIANADSIEGLATDEPLPDGALARGAATAIMDSDGTVPHGSVGRSLLRDDPQAPFGVKLDHDAVLSEFDEAWNAGTRTVALVEASDLSRAAAYRKLSDPRQRAEFRRQSLADADRLLGELLTRVDPERDSVIVLSPVSAPGLGIAGLAAPGIEPALLRSATTRRDGYLQLADFAPTVLYLLGEDVPEGIEGRPFDISGSVGGDERIDRLEADAAAAERHDELLPLIFGCAALAAALLLVAVLVRSRRNWIASLIDPLAYGILGFVPATFLVGGITALAGSKAGYLATVAGFTVTIALVLWAIGKAASGMGALVGVALIVVLIAGDLLTGANLQVNTAFGYSLAVAGRFVGLGNLAFALLGSAAIVLAGLLVYRLGKRGMVAAVCLLPALVVTIGLPMFGADVGGLVTTVPAFGATLLLLAGRRIGPREVILLGLTTAGALLLVAIIDALRPADVQTHLVRTFDDVFSGRWELVFKTFGRRLAAGVGDVESAGWILVSVISLAAAGYAVHAVLRPSRSESLALSGAALAVGVGLGLVAVLGVVANDSSFAVPAVMLLVIVPVVALRAMSTKEVHA